MNQLVNETFQSLIQYVPNLINYSDTISNNLRNINEEKNMELLKQYLEGVHWVFRVVENLVLLENDMGMTQSEINTLNNELVELLKKQDYYGLAEFVEYELVPLFNKIIVLETINIRE